MDADLTCAFGRALRALGRDEPWYEHDVTRSYYPTADETQFQVSWVGAVPEVPEWLARETYDVERRWCRHYLQRRAKGHVQGVAIFDAPEVAELARVYVEARYGQR